MAALENKNRELERGYSFKSNPIESKLRLEIGELQSQLSDLKQNSAPASDLSAKTKAICKIVKPYVSAKYVETLNAQIKKEMERE